jgi:hypothetical protein
MTLTELMGFVFAILVGTIAAVLAYCLGFGMVKGVLLGFAGFIVGWTVGVISAHLLTSVISKTR